MHAVVRALPLALGFAALSLHAEDALPPIFAPRLIEPAPSTPPAESATLISGRLRTAINSASQRALASATPFSVPAVTRPREREERPIMMERIIVRSVPLQWKEPRKPLPPLLDFVKNGTIYHAVHGNRETEVYFTLTTIVQKWGLQRERDFTRVELGFSLKW